MAFALFNALAFCVSCSLAQSIHYLKSSGGSGPTGGIGDLSNPVLEAKAFITDALIPIRPNTTRQLAKGKPPVLLQQGGYNRTNDCPPPRTVLVDDLNGGRQQFLGFGFSWTDSSVEVINRLTPPLQHELFLDLFSEKGINLGMMRHTIGSSDLSGRQYSFDDNGPSFNEGEPDLGLQAFSLGEDGTAMVEMIQKMGEYKGDIFLIGSPWSLPGWMKHNGLFVAPNLNAGTSYNILNNSFDRQYVPQAVQYFQRYIEAYEEHGVFVDAISLMNEPLNYQGGTTTMYLDAADAADILNYGLGTFLKERNIALLAYDHNTDQAAYPSQVIQRARQFVDAAAWHCYAYLANYSVLEDFHYAYPDRPQFLTECASYLPRAGSIDWQVANAFMPALQHGASGANMWVLATDPDYGPHSPYGGCAGCEGAIIVNSSTTYTKTNSYYMVGQFSRFIRRGSTNYRILKGNEGDHLTPNQFNVLAAQNPDDSWAIIIVNNLNRTESVRLSFTGSGDVWEGVIPNATVTTWLLPSERYLYRSKAYDALANGTLPDTRRFPNSTCKIAPTSTIATSSSSESTPLLPVPHTDHVIPQNVL